MTFLVIYFRADIKLSKRYQVDHKLIFAFWNKNEEDIRITLAATVLESIENQ